MEKGHGTKESHFPYGNQEAEEVGMDQGQALRTHTYTK
jgi:hypothetical protein